MTQEEYLEMRDDEQKSFNARMRELDLHYAKSINKVSIGDTIDDKFEKSIIVKTIVFNRFKQLYGTCLPHFDYKGIALRKDGSVIYISYENIVKINGKKFVSEDLKIKKGGNDETK